MNATKADKKVEAPKAAVKKETKSLKKEELKKNEKPVDQKSKVPVKTPEPHENKPGNNLGMQTG
jgi:hypothetical protein